MSQDINWDRLRREAEERYKEEARRRQKLGDQAREDAERLARKAEVERSRGVDVVADQSVYMYVDDIMVAHFPQSTMFDALNEPEGTGYQIMLFSPSLQRYVRGPYYSAKELQGHRVFVGRGHPGE